MTEKWTPGEWLVSTLGLINNGARPIVTDECRIASVDLQDETVKDRDAWKSEDPVRDANAHLIVAAPDLYRALKAAEDYLAFNATETSQPYPLAIVRAALAKARGEA